MFDHILPPSSPFRCFPDSYQLKYKFYLKKKNQRKTQYNNKMKKKTKTE